MMIPRLLPLICLLAGMLPLASVGQSPLYLRGEISGLVHDETSMNFLFSGRLELSFTDPGVSISPGKKRTTVVQEVAGLKISIRDMVVTDAEKNSKQLEELFLKLSGGSAKGPVTFFLVDPFIRLDEDGKIGEIRAPWLHLNVALSRRVMIPPGTGPAADPAKPSGNP